MLVHICTQPKRRDGTGGGRGKRVGGVLRYLFGPGRAEEHVNTRYGEGVGTPYGRLVAASGAMPIEELQPQATAQGHFDYRPLVDWLEELPRAAGVLRRVDGRHTGPGWVWHASLRLAPEDRRREVSDETWAHMAREMLRGAGLVVDGDEAGVRWVVVRHAEDHVHIVATLVREDGRREWFRNDFYRCVDATQQVAARMGLRQVARGRRGAHRRPHPVEVRKAARQGRFAADGGVLTVRDELRRRVRAAAVAAGSADEFVARLQQQGVRVQFRNSEAHPGERTGVKFALVGDVTAAGAPVWYGGGRLAPDLTWPKLRGRWAAEPLPGLEAATLAAGRDRAGVLRQAERIVRRVEARLRRGGPVDAAAVGQAAADCMTAAGWLLHHGPDGRLIEAAEKLDAAMRQSPGPRPYASPDAAALHALAQALFTLQAAADDEEERQTLRMMHSLCVLAERAARLRRLQHRGDQTADVRAAVAAVRGAISQMLGERGRRMTPAEQARQAATVRQVLPGLADRILAETSWTTLAAALDAVEAGGADPREALRRVARWRDLNSAKSISQVLAWRLRRNAVRHDPQRPAPAGSRPRRTSTRVPRRDAAATAGQRPTR